MVGARGESTQGSDIVRELPGYRIVRQLGRGSMGVVYLAEDVHLGRNIALKILAPTLVDGELFRKRFDRESHNAANLDHPNIIPVYAAGEAAGALYIAMRYVSGGDLRALLETNGPLSLTQASAVIVAVADALDAAHAQGMVHRDVKPANILIDSRNGQEHYYLSDFGIAKIASTGQSLTSTGQILGTIDYIAPEQVQGKPVDGRADLYALGCVLYHCLTGAVPFRREDIAALMWAHVHEAPPLVTARRPDLPPQIDHIVAKTMAKQPEDRYATCRELALALRALAADPATSDSGKAFPAPPTNSPAPPPAPASMTSTYLPLTPAPARASAATSPPRRAWWRLAAFGVLTLALIAGSTIAILNYLSSRFLNEAERALLAQLALTPKDNCTRNTETDTEPDAANIQASLICTPDRDAYSIVFTKFTSLQALRDHYNADVVTAHTGQNSGDCRTAEKVKVEGAYTGESGRTSGRVLCGRNPGSSFIEWTDEKSLTLGLAKRLDRDHAKLREWWADEVDAKPTIPEPTQAPSLPSSPAPTVPRSAPEAHEIPRLALEAPPASRPAPEVAATGPVAKAEDIRPQPAQTTNAPTPTPSNPISATITAPTTASPTSAPSTPSAPPAKSDSPPKLDSLDGRAPHRPGLRQEGPPQPGTGGCAPPASEYYECNVTFRAPVYRPGRTDNLGYLRANSSPWFRCQSPGGKYSVGNHTNRWWAWLDDSYIGVWVPVIFLAGSHDDQPEPGLPICDSPSTTTTKSSQATS